MWNQTTARVLVVLAVASLGASSTIACSSSTPSEAPAARASAVPVSQPGLVSVTGRATRGTTVALEPADGTEAPPPAGPVVMDQRGGQFLPGLLLARVGQPVEFRNGESINHNVYVTRGAAAAVELNVSTDPGEAYTHTFTRTGAYDVSCDIHPSMRASLVVVDTPWSAIGDDFGRFVIMNVPPGRYRLMTIPAGSAETRTVEIGGDHVDLGAL